MQAPVEVPDSSDAVWRKGQPAVSERAVGREPPFDRLGGRWGAPIAARRVPRRPNDRGDLGAILREDARYDLLHVGLVVDDQHPDAIETRATVERNYATRHAVMSSRFRLKSAGALPAKSGHYCSRPGEWYSDLAYPLGLRQTQQASDPLASGLASLCGFRAHRVRCVGLRRQRCDSST